MDLPTNFDNNTNMQTTHPAAHNETNTAINALQNAVIQSTFSTSGLNKQIVYNVKDYGVIGNGVADDSSAINALVSTINGVGGGTIYFPAGTYLCNSAIQLLSKVKFEGQGNSSIIKCTGGNNLFTWSTNISRLEFYNLQLTATNGHIFAPTTSNGKFGYTKIHHCWLTQNSKDYAIWYQTTGNLIQLLFEENYVYVAGTSRTVPGWYNLDPLASCNSNWWKNNTFESAGDSAQPMIYIECTANGDYSYDNRFTENIFEVCEGGCIQLLSQIFPVIEGCRTYDTSAAVQGLIKISRSAAVGALSPTAITIRDSGRIGSGIGVGVEDIYLDSHCRQVVIENFRATPDTGIINLNACTDVYLIGVSPGTTINNPSTTQIKLVSSGAVTLSQLIASNNTITASGNAATVPITSRINTVVNNSAATLTITLTTAGAVSKQLVEVCLIDFSAVAQSLVWVNTENSSVSAPTTSNGSTTLPLSALFQFNGNTSKWRCLAVS